MQRWRIRLMTFEDLVRWWFSRFPPVHQFILALFLSIKPSFADTTNTSAYEVLDGDTLSIIVNHKTEQVRLYGIDAPEIDQDYGPESKILLKRFVQGQTLAIEQLSKDRNGFTLAYVKLSDGTLLNFEMVRHGYAWWYKRQAPFESSLSSAQNEARVFKRGLWAQANPVPPWIWITGQSK